MDVGGWAERRTREVADPPDDPALEQELATPISYKVRPRNSGYPFVEERS